MPETKEHQERPHGDEGARDIHNPGTMEITNKKLDQGKSSPANETSRPHLEHRPKSHHYPNKPERHNQRKQRQLPTDRRAELFNLETGDGCERDNLSAERS